MRVEVMTLCSQDCQHANYQLSTVMSAPGNLLTTLQWVILEGGFFLKVSVD